MQHYNEYKKMIKADSFNYVILFHFKYVSESLATNDVLGIRTEFLTKASDMDINSTLCNNNSLPYTIHKLLTIEHITAIG